jgi:RNA polymerase sigma factor (sigma-70 family)
MPRRIESSACVLNDATLVARTLAGEREAYDELVRRHFSAAVAAALALTATREDAEDACQDAFARGYFRLDSCREPERFGAWIGQIVRRCAHNLRAYQALRRCASLDDGIEPVARDRTDAAVEDADLDRALAGVLLRLSPVKRMVVMRFELDGWTHEQIASALGISVFMSRRHLSEARRELRRLLVDIGYGEADD